MMKVGDTHIVNSCCNITVRLFVLRETGLCLSVSIMFAKDHLLKDNSFSCSCIKCDI